MQHVRNDVAEFTSFAFGAKFELTQQRIGKFNGRTHEVIVAVETFDVKQSRFWSSPSLRQRQSQPDQATELRYTGLRQHG